MSGLSGTRRLTLRSRLVVATCVASLALAAGTTGGAGAAAQVDSEPGVILPGSDTGWSPASLPRTRSGLEVFDVISGGPGFIAVGGGWTGPRAAPEALIWVSDDGRRWQSVPLFGDAAVGVIESVTATPAGFVAVGRECCPDRAAVWVSDEGIIWDRLPHGPVFEDAAMFDVTASPSGLVAVGCQVVPECVPGTAWRSEDGTVWEGPSALPLVASAVGAFGEILIAGGTSADIQGSAALADSADGSTWSLDDGDAPPGRFDAIDVFEGEVLAAGGRSDVRRRGHTGYLLRSADAGAWGSVTSPTFRSSWFEGIATSDTGILLVGWREDARSRTYPLSVWSDDLATFREVPFRGRPIKGIVHAAAIAEDGSRAVAVGSTLAGNGAPAIWVLAAR